MQELNIVLACLEQSENTFLFNKVKKVMEDLEFYHQEIRKIINDSQS
jgi:hypothetical protein